MNRSNIKTLQQNFQATRWMCQSLALLFIALTFTTPLKASEQSLQQAEFALSNEQFVQAKRAFMQLMKKDAFRTQAQFGLARIFLYTEDLDAAEKHIESVLRAPITNPDHLFIAGRIAAAQAQHANLFSKLGYARDAKRYFTQALEIDNKHQASLIGLIRFHQKAPVLAGGDKDAIPELVKQLSEIDQRASFAYEAPTLLANNNADQVISLYRAALKAPSTIDTDRFKFDFAMLMSAHEHYQPALEALLSIEIHHERRETDYSAMLLYQIGKLAAETNSRLDDGIENMKRYTGVPEKDRTIPQDWVDFRLAQLEFLRHGKADSLNTLHRLRKSTSDEQLVDKIESFLRVN